MLAVLGLFTPITKSVANVAEAESASRVADAVRARLNALPFAQAAALIKDPALVQANDASGAYNPNDGTTNPTVIFGRLSGEVAFYDAEATPPTWYEHSTGTPRALADADKFFEIDLIRNEALSPRGENDANDATAAMIAYNIRVRWPAFVRTSPTTAVQFGQNPAGGPVPFDHGKKQVLFFTGALMR